MGPGFESLIAYEKGGRLASFFRTVPLRLIGISEYIAPVEILWGQVMCIAKLAAGKLLRPIPCKLGNQSLKKKGGLCLLSLSVSVLFVVIYFLGDQFNVVKAELGVILVKNLLEPQVVVHVGVHVFCR